MFFQERYLKRHPLLLYQAVSEGPELNTEAVTLTLRSSNGHINWFLFLCLCLCLFLCMCLSVSVSLSLCVYSCSIHVCVYIYMCRPEDKLWCCHSGYHRVCLETGSLSLELTDEAKLEGQWAQYLYALTSPVLRLQVPTPLDLSQHFLTQGSGDRIQVFLGR